MSLLRHLPTALLLMTLVLGPAACCCVPAPAPKAVIDLPQDPAALLPAPGQGGCLARPAWQKEQAAAYLKQYFDCWQRKTPRHTRAELLRLGHRVWEEPGTGANLKPHAPGWAQGLLAEAKASDYPSTDWRGMTLRACDLRVLPTTRPDYGPGPGGGYPFDRLQQTSLPPGLPVRVWHASPRGDWLVAETPLAMGWLPARAVGWVNPSGAASWMAGPFVTVTRDQAVMRSQLRRYLGPVGLGTLWPSRGRRGGQWRVRYPLEGLAGRAVLAPARLSLEDAAPFPLALTPANLGRLAGQVMGAPYGWGGLYGLRDCSALTRDLLAPFGLWLPRNSADQTKAGQVVSLEGLSTADKLAVIKKRGVPWLSLLYMPGHVMLYLGSPGGEPRVLHAMWGLRTQGPDGQGRELVGRVVITGLTPGEHLPHLARPEGLLLHRLSALVILVPPGALCPPIQQTNGRGKQ